LAAFLWAVDNPDLHWNLGALPALLRYCQRYCILRNDRQTRFDVMRIWLEHDPVAFAILVLGIAAVELLVFSF
jgi:hypothetical protein